MKMLELQDKVNLGKFKNTFHLAVYKVTFCYMHKWYGYYTNWCLNDQNCQFSKWPVAYFLQDLALTKITD